MARGERIAQSKNQSMNFHKAMADCNSAMELQQCSSVAAWILQWYYVIFTAGRHELFSVSSVLAR